jgi:hypothetical protein
MGSGMGMGSGTSAATGSGNVTQPDMSTSGLGDTEIRGIYKINNEWVASLGLSLPTGSIDEETMVKGASVRVPYGMQLGTGTYDLKPALTWLSGSADGKWSWGAQGQFVVHTGNNDHDYHFGDSFKAIGWMQRNYGPAVGWVRMAYTNTDKIHGEDPDMKKMMAVMPSPDANKFNYGGERLDGLLGVGYTHRSFSLGIEAGAPLYQYVNGLQLKTQWLLNFGAQIMF